MSLDGAEYFLTAGGKIKHDRLQKDENEVFISFLGYERKVTGVVLFGIKYS
jgi:hypothetical protein